MNSHDNESSEENSDEIKIGAYQARSPSKPKEYAQLTPHQIFLLALQEVEKKVSDNPIVIDIEVPHDLDATSNLLVAGALVPRILARVFIDNDNIAHVVYYPGVDTNKLKETGHDIPLQEILEYVDSQLTKNEKIKNCTAIRKHIIVGKYGNVFSENHFTAITNINGHLHVINPKNNPLSDPDMDYLKMCLPNIREKPLSAGIQGLLDPQSCGYFVAAILAEAVNKDVTLEKIKTIKKEEACQAFDTVHFEEEKKYSRQEKEKQTVSLSEFDNPKLDDDWIAVADLNNVSDELIQTISPKIIPLPYLPPQIQIEDIKYIDSKGNCFFLDENEMDENNESSIIQKLKDKHSGRLRKNNIGCFYNIVKIENNYYAIYKGVKHDTQIGAGATGTVKIAQCIYGEKKGEWVALKMAGIESESEQKALAYHKKDRGHFTHFSRVKGFRDGQLMELESGIPLLEYINSLLQNRKNLSTAKWLNIVIGIATVVKSLQVKKILHRDIKVENLIYNPLAGRVTIIDWELMIQFKKNQVSVKDELKGTVPMLAPSIIADRRVGKKGSKPCTYNFQTELYATVMTIAFVLGFLDRSYKIINSQHPDFQRSDIIPSVTMRTNILNFLTEILSTFKNKALPNKGKFTIRTVHDFLRYQFQILPEEEKIEKVAIIEVSQRYRKNDLKQYDRVILVDSNPRRNIKTYYSIKRELENDNLVVDDKTYVSKDLTSALVDISNEDKPSSFFEKCRYTDLTSIIPRKQLSSLQKMIFEEQVWVINGGFFAGHRVGRKNTDEDLKVPANVKKMLDQIEKAHVGKISYRFALENIIKIAVKQSNSRTWLTDRDKSTQEFYSNIFKTLKVDTNQTLSAIQIYIENMTLEKQWETWFHKCPSTIEKIWKIISDEKDVNHVEDKPTYKNSTATLNKVLQIAMSAAETNNQLTNLRSEATKSFYQNITQFIVLKHENLPVSKQENRKII